MSVLRFNCPHCGLGYEVPEQLAGRHGKCSRCGRRIRIGGVLGAAAPTPLPPTPTPALPGGDPRQPVHVLVRLGDGTFPIEDNLRRLVPGQRIHIGRALSCDISVRSPRVSRRHASITWRGDEAAIRDLGSHNGTQVNGQLVNSHALVDGDEITVGPFVVTYLRRLPAELSGALEELANSRVETQFTRVEAMSGRIELVTVLELLQVLEFNRKTGTLAVRRKDGSRGRIGIEEGNAVFAELGDLRGEDAIQAILTWDEGTFAFKPELEGEPAFRLPITGILLEAQRRIDEAR